MYVLYIYSYILCTYTYTRALDEVRNSKKPQNCKIIILEQMQDYSYGSVALTHLCYSMFS